MSKIISKSSIFAVLIASLISLINKTALAQTTCTLNGQTVPCDQLVNEAKSFLGWGLAGFIVLFILGILSTIFWVMMIIHAAKHNIDNKAMWIILLVFTGIIGALIYYFEVKKKMDKQTSPVPLNTPSQQPPITPPTPPSTPLTN